MKRDCHSFIAKGLIMYMGITFRTEYQCLKTQLNFSKTATQVHSLKWSNLNHCLACQAVNLSVNPRQSW